MYPSNAERVSDTRLDTQEGQIKLCIAKHSCAKSRNKKPMNHYNSWVYISNHYKTVHMITKNWWAQTDLNCRPTDYESAALTNWAIGPFHWNCYISTSSGAMNTSEDFFKLQAPFKIACTVRQQLTRSPKISRKLHDIISSSIALKLRSCHER